MLWNSVIGILIPTSNGTIIEVKLVPHPHLYALVPALFFLLFLGFWISSAVSAVRNGLVSASLECMLLLFLGMAAAVWIIYRHVTSENKRLADFLRRTIIAK